MQAARPDKSTVIFKVVLGLLLYFITSALVIRFTTDGRSHASICRVTALFWHSCSIGA
ncbi:hypothetical protein [Acetobacter papayae]|uniref:hypothetical protein n=1 Tax=Acetobacter papayae TaxID=1076592 RepID=UPI000B076769|nr:hypothetical protein [Acetobacter papayae]